MMISGLAIGLGVIGMSLWYLLKMRTRVIDDLVVNMIDVGEERVNWTRCCTRLRTTTTKKCV